MALIFSSSHEFVKNGILKEHLTCMKRFIGSFGFTFSITMLVLTFANYLKVPPPSLSQIYTSTVASANAAWPFTAPENLRQTDYFPNLKQNT